MRTGAWIPPFITRLTGITNAMVAAAPPAEEVMRDAARFVGSAPMVAHNAAFDSKFWQSELALAGEAAPQPFACPVAERAHRALADAEMAAALLARMQQDLCRRYALAWPEHALLMQLQRCARARMGAWLHENAAPAQMSMAL
jgi:DNA polymerase-3 subunit epsilon